MTDKLHHTILATISLAAAILLLAPDWQVDSLLFQSVLFLIGCYLCADSIMHAYAAWLEG